MHTRWSSYCAIRTEIVSADYWLKYIKLVMKPSRTNETEKNKAKTCYAVRKKLSTSASYCPGIVEKYRCINQKYESSLWVWAWNPVYISHYSGMLVADLQHRRFDLGTAVALLAELQDDVTNLDVVTPNLYVCFLLLAQTLAV